MITIADIFDESFKHVKFNNNLARLVYHYQFSYINKSKEYMEFFGGNLIGTHIVRFTTQDEIRFFNEVLDIDYLKLLKEKKRISTIDHSRKVSSDLFNLTIMYMIHRFLTNPTINDRDRNRAIYDLALLFFMRCLVILNNDWFKFPADPKIVQAAYSRLSKKFLIKELGSWHKVLDYRAKKLVDKNEIHFKRFVDFKDDLETVYIINDSQGRIRDIMKGYYSEFVTTHSEGDNILTTSSTIIDVEGELVLKDKIGTVETYITYLKGIVIDKDSFIKNDLLNIITGLNTNTSNRMLRSVLEWISDNYNSSKYHNDIDEFLDIIIIHSFHLLSQNNITNMRDYPKILVSLKNLYLSTRSTDVDLEKIRNIGEKLITASQDTKLSKSLLMSTRTALILYIIFRSLVGITK